MFIRYNCASFDQFRLQIRSVTALITAQQFGIAWWTITPFMRLKHTNIVTCITFVGLKCLVTSSTSVLPLIVAIVLRLIIFLLLPEGYSLRRAGGVANITNLAIFIVNDC